MLKMQMTKTIICKPSRCRFEHLKIRTSDLFRASCFVLRISDLKFLLQLRRPMSVLDRLTSNEKVFVL